MKSVLINLHEVKTLSGEEIAKRIQELAPNYRGRAEALHNVLDKGRIFKMMKGSSQDLAAVQTALLSIVLAAVSVYDPYSRTKQTSAIREACEALGLSYEEVLELTVEEERIKAVLLSGDDATSLM